MSGSGLFAVLRSSHAEIRANGSHRTSPVHRPHLRTNGQWRLCSLTQDKLAAGGNDGAGKQIGQKARARGHLGARLWRFVCGGEGKQIDRNRRGYVLGISAREYEGASIVL